MLDKLSVLRSRNPEEGFTLMELVIVVVIVGILGAVATLIFMNQQKSAIDATLQSDLKNALTAMQTESVKTKGWFPSFLPLDAASSKGNTVILIDNADNVYSDPKFENGSAGWSQSKPAPSNSNPPRGNSILLDGRDHKLSTDQVEASPGDLIEITITARQNTGTLPLQAGIWHNGIPDRVNCAPYMIYPTITEPGKIIKEFPDGWKTYRHVLEVPSQYRNTTTVCPDKTIAPNITVAPFLQIGQGLVGQDPNGTHSWEVSDLIYRNLTDLSAGSGGRITGEGNSRSRILQSVCIEAYNNADRSNVWSITNFDGVPKQQEC